MLPYFLACLLSRRRGNACVREFTCLLDLKSTNAREFRPTTEMTFSRRLPPDAEENGMGKKNAKRPNDHVARVRESRDSVKNTVRIGTAYAPRRQRSSASLSREKNSPSLCRKHRNIMAKTAVNGRGLYARCTRELYVVSRTRE